MFSYKKLCETGSWLTHPPENTLLCGDTESLYKVASIVPGLAH